MAIIAKERPDIILATSDDGIFLVAAYQTARATKTPLYVLLLDIYAGNNYSWIKRAVARVLEPRILRHADVVIVTNSATRRHYHELYGINAVVLEHPAALTTPRRARARRTPSLVAYTGSVYWAQRDALAALVRAIDLLDGVRVQLISDLEEEQLRRLGVWSRKVDVRHSNPAEVQDLQARADVLYLPLAFRGTARAVIRTAAPGKMAEYLISGVPILVHAPRYSYIAHDARESGWALVVDQPDERAVRHAVQELLENQPLRDRLVATAYALAARRHHAARIGEQFRRLFMAETL